MPLFTVALKKFIFRFLYFSLILLKRWHFNNKLIFCGSNPQILNPLLKINLTSWVVALTKAFTWIVPANSRFRLIFSNNYGYRVDCNLSGLPTRSINIFQPRRILGPLVFVARWFTPWRLSVLCWSSWCTRECLSCRLLSHQSWVQPGLAGRCAWNRVYWN